ncbi:CopG family ribbon-helix-helix protein [Ilumatobacter sp.]|uniref:CopG family ribbon-helix-helix protein n=1 Tax=Ilumatobacter sp. TaxID=1967498 RepID=UPI003C31ACFF
MTWLYFSGKKPAVSIPDAIFDAADRLAGRRRVSRSELYAQALRKMLDDEDDLEITARLDDIYASGAIETEPVVADGQHRFLDQDSW